jgi:serine/threonine-protein kinase
MGAVYLAEDLRLNRKVALKFFSSDFISGNWAKRQLIKEAQAVAILDHPNICAVHGLEETDEHSFIVMQYIEGETLADLIKNGSLTSNQIVPLAQQIVSALDCAHAHGIIHRDVKPRNIMVTPTGQVKVLDFGLAKTIPVNLEDATESISHLSRDGLFVGTIAYMSPEQLRGEKLDYRSDIFSLGTVLYEMTCGKNPYAHKTTAEIISAIMSGEPESLREVSINCPRALDRIVGKCLSKDRADRYQSAAELLIDLDNVQKGIGLPARTPKYLNLKYAAFAAGVLLMFAIVMAIRNSWPRAQQRLAVLPIVCDDSSSHCAGAEISENLVRSLSRRSGLKVASSSIAPSFFGPQAASPEIVGRGLNADVVMYGRIVKGEHGLILNLRWQNVIDGSRIAEEYYPVNPDKILLLSQQLSFDTASYLHLPMSEEDKTIVVGLAQQENKNPDAEQLYRDGRMYWARRDFNSINKALESFDQATVKDMHFAQAWAGVSDCYVLMNTVAYDPATRRDAMPRADYAANKALELNDNLAEAHNAKAAVLMKRYWDWTGAEKEFKRAVALSPDYSPAHWGYSNLLITSARFDEAIAEGQIAKDLDPLTPQSQLNFCRLLFFARRFDQAYPCYDRLMTEHPDFSAGRYARGVVYLVQGKYDEAIQIFDEIYQKDAKMGAMLGFSYGMAGRREDALRVLSKLQELQHSEGLPAQEVGLVYLGMNDLNNALPLFRDAIQEKYPPTQSIFIDPMYDRLRADPRYPELVRDVKPPAQWPTLAASSPVSAK